MCQGVLRACGVGVRRGSVRRCELHCVLRTGRGWPLPRARVLAAYSTVADGQPVLTMDMALSVANATYTQFDRGLQGQALQQLQVCLPVQQLTVLFVCSLVSA